LTQLSEDKSAFFIKNVIIFFSKKLKNDK
jgi:hypothetical protein